MTIVKHFNLFTKHCQYGYNYRILMPKKTKEAKIISGSRKKIEREYHLSTEENKIKNNFIKDFKKSLLIIIFIFTLEIILYFVSMSTYVSDLLRF